jgi:hypothetical protein
LQIIQGINEYLEKYKMDSVEQLIGGLQM